MTRVKQNTASNSVFRINFDPPLDDTRPPDLFGAKYNMYLEGVVDCPEFLVHFSTLVDLAEKYGLILIRRSRFDSYFNTVNHFVLVFSDRNIKRPFVLVEGLA